MERNDALVAGGTYLSPFALEADSSGILVYFVIASSSVEAAIDAWKRVIHTLSGNSGPLNEAAPTLFSHWEPDYRIGVGFPVSAKESYIIDAEAEQRVEIVGPGLGVITSLGSADGDVGIIVSRLRMGVIDRSTDPWSRPSEVKFRRLAAVAPTTWDCEWLDEAINHHPFRPVDPPDRIPNQAFIVEARPRGE